MTTDTAADTFTDIVADIPSESHFKCRVCNPPGKAPVLSVCGVILLDEDPDADSVLCTDCMEGWSDHVAAGHHQ